MAGDGAELGGSVYRSGGAGPSCAKRRCELCSVRELNACKALPDSAIEHLAAASYCRKAAAGDTIVMQGDPAEWLFHLRTGSACTSVESADGRRQITEFLFAGDVFGFPRKGAYAFTVEALTDCDLCMFDRAHLEQLSDEHPTFALSLAALEADELDRMHLRLFTLGRQRAEERIAALLCGLALRQEADVVQLPTSRAEIADYLGLTPETVSRMLTRFEREGVIETVGARRIAVHDQKRLREIASGHCDLFGHC